MTDNTLYQAPGGWLASAVDTLCAAGVEVVAPTGADGAVELSAVTSSDSVTLDYANSRQPLKRLFFPETEPILGYRTLEGGDVDVQPAPLCADGEMVIFGVRPCDAAALEVLDAVFQWDYDDLLYRARRDRATVVTFACAEPDEHCFCTSVDGSPHSGQGSDVVAFPDGDGGSLLRPLTPKGEAFIERLTDVVKPAAADAQLPDEPALAHRFSAERVRTWLDDNFESEFWQDAALRCLGCGACSFLCPTCHCFDIVDEGTWKEGERRRNWDCCSFALFTKHASGHNPRTTQAARYRQRVMHKFKYFPERFGPTACVGCGRCTRVCGVGQSLVGVLSEIETLGAEAPGAEAQ